MLPLDDPRWEGYVGGYRVPCDAPGAIRRLLDGPDPRAALEELEEELCHQGDLGPASYAAVPWLVEYVRRQPELEVRAVALILTIEFGRPFNGDDVPDEVRPGYDAALASLAEIVLSKRGGWWGDDQVMLAAAVLALSQGNRWMARTYFELDRRMLEELLREEFGSAEWDWWP
jgi:hypothetical protein